MRTNGGGGKREPREEEKKGGEGMRGGRICQRFCTTELLLNFYQLENERVEEKKVSLPLSRVGCLLSENPCVARLRTYTDDIARAVGAAK